MAKRLLIVETEGTCTALAYSALPETQWWVANAADPQQARERVDAEPPDVIICETGLPGMSGYDFARSLREAGFGMPIVFCGKDIDIFQVDEIVCTRAIQYPIEGEPFREALEAAAAMEPAQVQPPEEPAQEEEALGVPGQSQFDRAFTRLFGDKGPEADSQVEPEEPQATEVAEVPEPAPDILVEDFPDLATQQQQPPAAAQESMASSASAIMGNNAVETLELEQLNPAEREQLAPEVIELTLAEESDASEESPLMTEAAASEPLPQELFIDEEPETEYGDDLEEAAADIDLEEAFKDFTLGDKEAPASLDTAPLKAAEEAEPPTFGEPLQELGLDDEPVAVGEQAGIEFKTAAVEELELDFQPPETSDDEPMAGAEAEGSGQSAETLEQVFMELDEGGPGERVAAAPEVTQAPDMEPVTLELAQEPEPEAEMPLPETVAEPVEEFGGEEERVSAGLDAFSTELESPEEEHTPGEPLPTEPAAEMVETLEISEPIADGGAVEELELAPYREVTFEETGEEPAASEGEPDDTLTIEPLAVMPPDAQEELRKSPAAQTEPSEEMPFDFGAEEAEAGDLPLGAAVEAAEPSFEPQELDAFDFDAVEAELEGDIHVPEELADILPSAEDERFNFEAEEKRISMPGELAAKDEITEVDDALAEMDAFTPEPGQPAPTMDEEPPAEAAAAELPEVDFNELRTSTDQPEVDEIFAEGVKEPLILEPEEETQWGVDKTVEAAPGDQAALGAAVAEASEKAAEDITEKLAGADVAPDDLNEIIREAVQKAVRDVVPSMAEKMVREAIEKMQAEPEEE